VGIDLAARVDPRLIVMDSGFISIYEMCRELYPFLPVGRLLSIKYDNLAKINKLKAPVVIIHSRDDEVVPYRHSEVLYEKVKTPKTMITMQGGHNDFIIEYKEIYADKLGRAFNKHGV